MRNANMKHIVFLGVCLMLASLTGPVWAQEDWQRVETQIDEEKERAEKDAALTERLVTMDRADMQKEVARLKSDENIRSKYIVTYILTEIQNWTNGLSKKGFICPISFSGTNF